MQRGIFVSYETASKIYNAYNLTIRIKIGVRKRGSCYLSGNRVKSPIPSESSSSGLAV